ncbi:polypeptide N-acetylgalactosaminyltransferase 17-like [Panthera uncia]|uniref:polypeptide N-acetylgalactosaminyltransferase 17-like n=1 Tax=Panthera uncia TaxID=29064 RepID=UPI0020FFD09E|nr:polypeptide N-acetylgalactosaminyltransferase 17-like [Panthera uncia]
MTVFMMMTMTLMMMTVTMLVTVFRMTVLLLVTVWIDDGSDDNEVGDGDDDSDDDGVHDDDNDIDDDSDIDDDDSDNAGDSVQDGSAAAGDSVDDGDDNGDDDGDDDVGDDGEDRDDDDSDDDNDVDNGSDGDDEDEGDSVDGMMMMMKRNRNLRWCFRRRDVIQEAQLVSGIKRVRGSTPKPGAETLKRVPGSGLTPSPITVSSRACLSKSLGLIEGYGGRGKGGLPATLSPAEEEKAKGPHEKYGYNSYLSEKISLDRSIPDYRPTKCKELKYSKELPQISIIFIFVNEALSVILRSVHSAVNHTPTHLLKEIILVDDNSDEEELKAPLEEYVQKRYPGLVKVVRNQKREGLIRARIEGWKAATGQVTGFFDAHVEFTAGWAEPVLSRIQENRKRVILPSIDNIKQDTFEVQRYENSAHGYSWELWCMYISPPKDWWDAGDPSLPIRSLVDA